MDPLPTCARPNGVGKDTASSFGSRARRGGEVVVAVVVVDLINTGMGEIIGDRSHVDLQGLVAI